MRVKASTDGMIGDSDTDSLSQCHAMETGHGVSNTLLGGVGFGRASPHPAKARRGSMIATSWKEYDALVGVIAGDVEMLDCPKANGGRAYQVKFAKGRIRRRGAAARDRALTLFEERLRNR